MKILATDMDGTFLDHLGAYDKARLDNLLDACEAKDYVFTVASGRALLALEELFDGFVDRIAIIAENIIDTFILIAVSTLVWVFAWKKKELVKWQGIVMLAIYTAYLVYICMR